MIRRTGKMEYYYCKKSRMVMLMYRLSMLKYLLDKKKYPLFFIGSSKGGIIKSGKLLDRMKTRKFVRFNGHFYFSLSVPHWPSRAFDHMVANGGLNIAANGTPYKKQIENAILGITGKCEYACIHCYERFNLDKKEDIIPVSVFKEIINKLQVYGVSIITLSGGEPMLRFNDMVEMLKTADHFLSDFHIHTSGFGVSQEKAKVLKEAGLDAAGIGLDDMDPARHDIFRGQKGAHKQALKAIEYFLKAGVFTYINTCLNKDLIRSVSMSDYMDYVKSLGVGFVRWLEPKPCGAFLQSENPILLSEEDRSLIGDFYIQANAGAFYHDYPVISYEAYMEAPENLGCIMGGNSLLYIDSAGNLTPCVFLPVTFGNVLTEDFTSILERMRKAIPSPLRSGCLSVQLNQRLKTMREEGSAFPVPYDDGIASSLRSPQ